MRERVLEPDALIGRRMFPTAYLTQRFARVLQDLLGKDLQKLDESIQSQEQVDRFVRLPFFPAIIIRPSAPKSPELLHFPLQNPDEPAFAAADQSFSIGCDHRVNRHDRFGSDDRVCVVAGLHQLLESVLGKTLFFSVGRKNKITK